MGYLLGSIVVVLAIRFYSDIGRIVGCFLADVRKDGSLDPT